MITVEFIEQGKIGEPGARIAWGDVQQVPAQWQHVRIAGVKQIYQVTSVVWLIDGAQQTATVYLQRCEQSGSAVKREGSTQP